MPDLAMLDYFYGDEAEQFTFYRIPKVLFTDPSYRRISSDAKILYGLMLDRMGLSVRNGWLDEYNRVFIFFTLEDALEYLCCGHTKAVSLFGELDKAGLIERKKQGQGKPTKIYVKNFVRNAEVLTSEKRKSKVPQSGSQDFQKTASNNTEIKDTELSDTEPSIHPARGLPEDKSPAADAMDTMRVYRQIIMENIEYDITRRQLGYDADILDEIVDIMVDTVCSTKPMIRIGGQDFPLEVVKSRLPSLHPFDLLVGDACGALLWFIVYQKSKNARKYRRGAEYGTARWGNAKDIEPFIDPDFSQNILLSETERLTLGKIADPEKRNVNLNVLVIGGSGSGKTRYHIKPNLLQMNASYVCSDPKGTVIEEVGRALVRGGYKIKVLNTIDFSCSMHYNPFVYLHSETDILTLVTVIMTNTQGEAKGGDGFWEKAEALLYQALIAYIYYEAPAEERNMNTLLDMLNACECREDDENFKSAVDLLFEQLEQRNPDHFAARQYKKFKMAAGKTLKSILISCGARLAPFDIAAVREMMSYDELELEKLGDEKTALFAVVSDTDPTFNFISAMMYSQMFNVLCDRALKVYHGRLPIHVTCLFDEFANQKIPNWEHLVSVIRSRNISAHIVLQTFSQLKGMYKDNAETVAGCCSTMLFLGGKEESSLKMVSGLLGKETIDTMNESDSRGAQRTYGLNYQKLGKELMSVDELAVMPSSRCIVQVQGVRPFYSKKYDLTKHPQYKYTADANPKFAFDVKAYLQHRLKVKPEEEFEVYDLGEIKQSQAAA